MSKNSSIEWTNDTWPIVTGCEFASKGCINCYALKDSWRLAHNPNPKVSEPYKDTVIKANGKLQWSGLVKCHPDRLDWVLKWGSWQDSHLVFVCNMGDLFHKDVPFEFVDQAVAYMIIADWNKYQILTKRPEIMAEYFNTPDRKHKIQEALVQTWNKLTENPTRKIKSIDNPLLRKLELPLRNVWLGCSVCNQKDAAGIEILLEVPAAVRFLSLEPLLEDIDLSEYLEIDCYVSSMETPDGTGRTDIKPIDWVIVGGESGSKARLTHIEHLRSIVQQCQDADIPVFVKQLGAEPVAHWDEENETLTMHNISDRKGGILEEFPADLQVQKFPA